MRIATLAAIDGVGVGTSLHYIDPKTKLMGALKPEAIREALRVRDETATEPFAQCSRLLARLDRMFANEGLGEMDGHYRLLLFEALKRGKEAQALKVAGGLARMEAMKPNFDYRFWSWVGGWEMVETAKRVLMEDENSALPAEADVADEWQMLLSRLEHINHESNNRPVVANAVESSTP
jgi:hypothetical protein